MFSTRHRHLTNETTPQTSGAHPVAPRVSRPPLWTRALSHTPHPTVQPKLTVSQPGDAYEREAEQVAAQVMRMPDPAHGGSDPARSGIVTGSGQGGQPLPEAARQYFEPRFGTDFSGVRVHTGDQAARAASAFNARAYTLGSDIVFGAGEYAPGSTSGQNLLAHELAHVVQQRSAPPMIQRDLSAYNKEKTEFMPNYGDPGMGGSTTYATTSAEAPGIRAALAQLIAAGKVSEIKSASGNKSWFAANHHKNAQLADIEKAFSDAGYSNAGKLARSLYDIHGEYLYSNETITTVTLFGDYSSSSGAKVRTETNRSMTEYEIRQARRVFKDAIKYNDVTIADGSISARIGSVGGYARTIGNTIYFPTGSTRSMAFMIHELTHVWQYQTTGWTYAPKALWAQVVEGYSYTPEGKTPDQALTDARAAGKTLTDFNKEQQGDILADYFRRLQSGGDVTAFQPFANDIK